MYDFLACRAIDFFRQLTGNEDLSITLAKKNIRQESLFAPAEVYITLVFDPLPSAISYVDVRNVSQAVAIVAGAEDGRICTACRVE